MGFRGVDRPGVVLLFSCPTNRPRGDDVGEREEAEFPESGVVLKARFNGLLGEARALVMREGGAVFTLLADRSESLTPGRRGVCAGDRCGALARNDEPTAGGADCGGFGSGRCCSGVVAANRRHGECEPCRAPSEACEFVLARSLEGDLDMDRRRFRTVAGSI